jgi:phage tail sheath gpL-like
MNLSNARATIGLSAKATPTSPNTSGSVQIGANPETISFPIEDVAYSLRAIFAADDDEMTINLLGGEVISADTFVAGAAQVETATAAGTVTASGNASVVVTAAGMTGSPKTINVPVLLNDTAAVWAGKVRAALAADSNVSELFSVSGTSTAIILTRKPTGTFNVPDGVLNFFAGNDSTLNIALSNGTSTGITTAATSANTTAGVASSGVVIYGGGGEDWEGNPISGIGLIKGIVFDNRGGDSVQAVEVSSPTLESITIPYHGIVAKVSRPNGGYTIWDSYTITADGPADLTITVIGASA